MVSEASGIGLVLGLALVASMAEGCGQVSLGSTTSVGAAGDASSDAGIAQAGSGSGAAAGGAGGEGAHVPYCGVSEGAGRVDCGDVHRDWTINSVDALLVAQYAEGMDVTLWLDAADVNCDGRITSEDATMIDERYVGLVTEFPCAPRPF
jgi:hypothetical protein